MGGGLTWWDIGTGVPQLQSRQVQPLPGGLQECIANHHCQLPAAAGQVWSLGMPWPWAPQNTISCDSARGSIFVLHICTQPNVCTEHAALASHPAAMQGQLLSRY